MASKKLMCVAAVILTWHSQNAAAQEKGDNAKLAKLVAETFAKEFIQDKNVEAAMKLTSVPFLQIEQGREQKPKRIEKSAGVQKQIQEIVKRHDEIGIRAKVTITKVMMCLGKCSLTSRQMKFSMRSPIGLSSSVSRRMADSLLTC